MKGQDWMNLATAIVEWLRWNWKKVVLLVLLVFLLGFCAGLARAAEAPTVNLTFQVGPGNVPTLTWSAPWASACTASGAWSGSKAVSGSQALPAITTTTTYRLSCSATIPGDTVAVLSWTAPTEYTDGSVLPATDVAAFRIYQGTSAGSLSHVAEVSGTTRSTSRSGLAAGTHYFAVTAVSSNGAESGLSAVGSKVATGGSTISDTKTVTVRIAKPPTLTVQATTAYDVRMEGLKFVLGRPVGEIPLGAPCNADFALDGGWYRVERTDVRLDRTPRSAVIVAQCG